MSYIKKHISTIKHSPVTLSQPLGACCDACAKTGGSCQKPLGDDIGAGTIVVAIVGFAALALFYKGVI